VRSGQPRARTDLAAARSNDPLAPDPLTTPRRCWFARSASKWLRVVDPTLIPPTPQLRRGPFAL